MTLYVIELINYITIIKGIKKMIYLIIDVLEKYLNQNNIVNTFILDVQNLA